MFTINITVQAVRRQGPWGIAWQGRATASVQTFMPILHASSKGSRLLQGGGQSESLSYRKDPFLQLPRLRKSRGFFRPQVLPSGFRSRLLSAPVGACLPG